MNLTPNVPDAELELNLNWNSGLEETFSAVKSLGTMFSPKVFSDCSPVLPQSTQTCRTPSTPCSKFTALIGVDGFCSFISNMPQMEKSTVSLKSCSLVSSGEKVGESTQPMLRIVSYPQTAEGGKKQGTGLLHGPKSGNQFSLTM